MSEEQPHTHTINVWQSKDDTLLGALIFLRPDEVTELQETGSVTITRDSTHQEDGRQS